MSWGLVVARQHALDVLILGLNYSPEPTGIAPYTTGLAEGLASRGHRVRVLTSFPHYPYWSFRADVPSMESSERNGVRLERHRHYVPKTPDSLRRVLFEVAFGCRVTLRRWGRPDVVLCVSPALISSAVSFTRARFLGRRRPALGLVIQDLYSSGVQETRAGGAQVAGALTWLERSTARAADGVVVIHERFAQQVLKRFALDAQKVTVIRNWTHVDQPLPVDRDDVRRSMKWGADEVVVLHAGAMGAKQGLDNVVEAARLADAQQLPLRFVLLGHGGQRASLEERALGIDRIDILDPLDQTGFAQALAAADVLLVNERPGVKEMAVPSKLTSYFNAGKPVLAATDPDSTTAFELAAAAAGVCVRPGQPEELIAGALLLAADREAAERMGECGREYAASKLSKKAAIEAYDTWVRLLAHHRVQSRRWRPSAKLRSSSFLGRERKTLATAPRTNDVQPTV